MKDLFLLPHCCSIAAKQTGKRLLLSATPMQNLLKELQGLLSFAAGKPIHDGESETVCKMYVLPRAPTVVPVPRFVNVMFSHMSGEQRELCEQVPRARLH